MRIIKIKFKKGGCEYGITWFGHACFKLLSDSGVSVITDPFDENVGYDLPGERRTLLP